MTDEADESRRSPDGVPTGDEATHGDVASPSALADVAEDAARDAGTILRESFRDGVEAEFGTDDVKAAVDETAERRIAETIRASYPDHVVDGEETGRSGDGPVEWIVDPVDGTNNYAVGYPSFAVAVAARYEQETLAAVIHEPLADDCYRAVRGGGATVNGDAIRADHDRPLDRSTVSLIVGLDAVRDPDLQATTAEIRDGLRDRTKRVLETWSPCVDWGLFARGSLAGVVCVHPDTLEQAPGELLAEEAGAVSVWEGEYYVAAADEATLATLRETLP